MMSALARTVRSVLEWAILILLLGCVVVPIMAGEGTVNRQAMADAMSGMMESMGLFGSGGSGSGAASSALPGPTGDSWGQAEEMGRQMMDGLNKTVPSGGLDGLWEAAGGGLLIVQGSNFRLYANNGAYVDGGIQMNGSRVRMVSRRSRFTLDLEYAQDQGRLAMRDERGRVYLYRRLILNSGS
jgi:hypothetical protein